MTTKTAANERFIGKDVPDEIALPLILERIRGRIHYAESGCHEYTGYVHVWGYAYIGFKGRNWKVHRLVWTAVNGPIPEGVVVMHLCDNAKCCNPAHLKLGTQQENIRHCLAQGRQAQQRKTHCPNGHAYAEHAEYVTSPRFIQQANPWRRCRECNRTKYRRSKAAKLANGAASAKPAGTEVKP